MLKGEAAHGYALETCVMAFFKRLPASGRDSWFFWRVFQSKPAANGQAYECTD
jgi:hypothetical protein